MSPKKTDKTEEEWVTAPRALAILKDVNGREINPKYLAKLGKNGRVRRIKIDGRTYQYHAGDLSKTILINRPSAVPRPGRPPKNKPVSQ